MGRKAEKNMAQRHCKLGGDYTTCVREAEDQQKLRSHQSAPAADKDYGND